MIYTDLEGNQTILAVRVVSMFLVAGAHCLTKTNGDCHYFPPYTSVFNETLKADECAKLPEVDTLTIPGVERQ